ncbi:MAG: acetate/propionate family kinase [Bacteroidales bacterium]|nr:acetate/propionate family kinase [Bacteroidales bacterium]
MSILVFNSGSTSLKYKLFSADASRVLEKGNFQNLKSKDHSQLLTNIIRNQKGSSNVKIVGHRIVHGGGVFNTPTVMGSSQIKKISQFNDLAPLHNPIQLKVLQLAQKLLPNVPHLGVFDTSFFSSLPDKSKIYPLPLEYYLKYGLQRFGFHGISHKYMAEKAALRINKKMEDINLITCHLGGGCSIVAIKKGRAIDTSMGFTPLEGLAMMSRSGDIDPGVLIYLNQSLGISVKEIYRILNFDSGIKGISGQDNFKDLLQAVKKKNKKAQLAFDIFIYRLQKYIGSYFAVLGKIDALVFSGAIGSGDPYTIKKIKKDLFILSDVKIFKVEADEELAIAQECLNFRNFF